MHLNLKGLYNGKRDRRVSDGARTPSGDDSTDIQEGVGETLKPPASSHIRAMVSEDQLDQGGNRIGSENGTRPR